MIATWKILLISLVLWEASVSSLISANIQEANYYGIRTRRQAGGPLSISRRSSGRGSGSGDAPFIPRIDPAPAGSILTYDGKAISTSIGAFSLVPRSERRTPSINFNRPQYASYRGDLPPPIPDVIPRDLPQFKDRNSLLSNFPPISQ